MTVVVGYPIGLWLASIRRFKRTLTSILLLPFVLPAFVVGLTFRPLVGDWLDQPAIALGAIVVAHTVMNAGFIAVVTASSLIPIDQIEAAQLDGASLAQVRRLIELPQQVPALSAAGLLVALYSATSFGLVVSLGQGSISTLETGIATAALQMLDLRMAGFLALLQSFLTLGFFLISNRLGAKPTVLFGEGDTRPHRTVLGIVVGGGLVLVIVTLVAGVFYRAVTAGPGLWGNILHLAGRGARDILNLSVLEAATNSLRNMLITLVISMVLAWWLSARKVGLAVLTPIGISPVVVGLGALVLSGYLPDAMVSSWVMLALVQSVFLIPLAYQIISPARRSLSTDLLDAARLDGATILQSLRLVEIPILAKPLAAAGALVSLGSLGEFGAARFLVYGSEQTLPLVMFRLISRPGGENLGMAMVTASAFICVAMAVVWLVSSVGQESRGQDNRG